MTIPEAIEKARNPDIVESIQFLNDASQELREIVIGKVLEDYKYLNDDTPVTKEWLLKQPKRIGDQFLWHCKVFDIPKEKMTKGRLRMLFRALCQEWVEVP